MQPYFSFVIPVYNRPEELRELFASLAVQDADTPFEVVVVEDGSEQDAHGVVEAYQGELDIRYFRKANTGPGDSRNFGMHRARGRFFLLVDSDCILPPGYLKHLQEALRDDPLDCFGGPDAADPTFSPMQQAISYTMTSVLTTGGLRGDKRQRDSFQPRSFNMGISREAFQKSGGFGNIHPGEDPDLSLRLRKLGFRLGYYPEVVVYHKRRVDFRSFYRQVYKFGLARPILNRWHPGSARTTYWFPTIFTLGLAVAIVLPLIFRHPVAWSPAGAYLAYLAAVGLGALVTTRNWRAACLAIPAVLVQFTGYGWGFLKSAILLTFSNKKPQTLFPGLFFNT